MLQSTSDKCYSEIMDRIRDKRWPSYFKPNPAPWFPNDSERCIEVPWALSRYQGQRKILEIGLSLADLTLIHAQIKLKELTECELYGLDIVDINRVLNRFEGLKQDIREVYNFFQGDVRNSDFENNKFDLVFCISTLEHFGFDSFESNKNANTVFKRPGEYPKVFPVYEECREDRKAIAELRRMLMPGGSLLLTLPLGKRGICVLKDSKGLWAFYKEYNLQEWRDLLYGSGLTVVEERFFRDAGRLGWIEEINPEQLTEEKGSVSDPVKGVACVELKRDK